MDSDWFSRYFNDDFSYLLMIISVFLVLIIGSIGVTLYSISDKHFEGYYLRHTESCYKIMINWENAEDEVAYKTFDGNVAIQKLKELKDIGY